MNCTAQEHLQSLAKRCDCSYDGNLDLMGGGAGYFYGKRQGFCFKIYVEACEDSEYIISSTSMDMDEGKWSQEMLDEHDHDSGSDDAVVTDLRGLDLLWFLDEYCLTTLLDPIITKLYRVDAYNEWVNQSHNIISTCLHDITPQNLRCMAEHINRLPYHELSNLCLHKLSRMRDVPATLTPNFLLPASHNLM